MYNIKIKMSMSTKIEDLPGPAFNETFNERQGIPNDILGDIKSIKNDQESYRQMEMLDENQSNVKMNVKKHVRFSEDIETFENEQENILVLFKNLLSEENVLLLILFLLSSQTDFDRYPRSIPYLGSYIDNPLIFTLIKCILLVLSFVLTKKFILPRIKL
jgi:hypothetical protein